MKGHVSGCEPVPLPDWTEDPEPHEKPPRPGGNRSLELRDLVLRVRPVPGADDGLPGELTGGTVHYAGRTYRVTGGRFVALAASPRGGRRLRYRIQAESATREPVEIVGVKRVTGRPWRWWADTTRMYVVVSTPDSETKCATGTVRIGWRAFARQLATFRGRPSDVAAFVVRFARRLVLT